MGYGFLEFQSGRTAKSAVSRMQDVEVDGHKLVLKISRRSQGSQKVSKRKRREQGKSSSKILARNIAFQANQKELRELFGAYGQLKKLRLPKKFDGTHRGFCFVEYLTEQEAKSAMESLENTHLYGRHMVLEWAKADESLEQLREKTLEHYQNADAAAEKGKRAADPSQRSTKLTSKMFKKRKT